MGPYLDSFCESYKLEVALVSCIFFFNSRDGARHPLDCNFMISHILVELSRGGGVVVAGIKICIVTMSDVHDTWKG